MLDRLHRKTRVLQRRFYGLDMVLLIESLEYPLVEVRKVLLCQNAAIMIQNTPRIC